MNGRLSVEYFLGITLLPIISHKTAAESSQAFKNPGTGMFCINDYNPVLKPILAAFITNLI